MKKSPKDVILARVRAGTANAPEPPPVPYDFRERDERDRAAILEDFIERLVDYKAIVTRMDDASLPQAVADACQQQGIIQLVVPADLPSRWIPSGVKVLRDDPPLTIAQLDESSGVLTGCAIAIAQTGTIILDGGATQGRRALSLIPDRHLAVVRAEQVVGFVPEASERLAERAMHSMRVLAGAARGEVVRCHAAVGE